MTRKERGAITALEIFVIVIILIILTVIVIPELLKGPDIDKMMREKVHIRALSSAVNLYFLDYGEFPERLKSLNENTFNKVYMEKIPFDRWGREYKFRVTNKSKKESFSIYSLGENGIDEMCKGDDICVYG